MSGQRCGVRPAGSRASHSASGVADRVRRRASAPCRERPGRAVAAGVMPPPAPWLSTVSLASLWQLVRRPGLRAPAVGRPGFAAALSRILNELLAMTACSAHRFAEWAYAVLVPTGWSCSRHGRRASGVIPPVAPVPVPTRCAPKHGPARGPLGYPRRPSQGAGRSRGLLLRERSSTMSSVT